MIRFAFFGSSEFSLRVLEALSESSFVPAVIVTTPDKPAGRGLQMTPNIVKSWGLERQIPVLDPLKLDSSLIENLKKSDCQVSVVASFGRIIPEAVLEAVPRHTLNVHPSLLPNYRGASPILTAILDDKKDTGVSIMRLDKEMDHGPIVSLEKMHFDEWPTYEETEARLGRVGGTLLAKILPDWIEGKIKEAEQDHASATYTKKVIKEDGLLDPADLAANASSNRAYQAFLKMQAYHAWPGAYFFAERNGKNIRIKITAASWQSGKLVIEKVIPEGRKEMRYKDFTEDLASRKK